MYTNTYKKILFKLFAPHEVCCNIQMCMYVYWCLCSCMCGDLLASIMANGSHNGACNIHLPFIQIHKHVHINKFTHLCIYSCIRSIYVFIRIRIGSSV